MSWTLEDSLTLTARFVVDDGQRMPVRSDELVAVLTYGFSRGRTAAQMAELCMVARSTVDAMAKEHGLTPPSPPTHGPSEYLAACERHAATLRQRIRRRERAAQLAGK